jgi:GDP-4-dehydro-6-deoxy-D-mannose reductase
VKVLVTGANGFVGSRLVTRLCTDGHEVVGARGPDTAAAAPAAARATGVTWVSLDVTDDDSVRACVAPPYDAVVHLAGLALASEANEHPARAWRVNADGTARVAWQLADVSKGRRAAPLLLVASSAEVYVPRTDRPHVESDPVAPVTGYAASKLGGELGSWQLWRAAGVRVIVSRAFPHTGAGQDPRFWIPARARILCHAKRTNAPAVNVGDLSAVRDFLHVDDVVDAYVRLLTRGVAGETYNIASGQPVTLEAIHSRLEQLLGIRLVREVDASQIRRDARPYLVGDASKLRAATGWAPSRSLDDMLRDVLDAQAH